jgi:hypothetical protein
MTWVQNPAMPCTVAGIAEIQKGGEQFMIMPNPSNGAFQVIYNSHRSQKSTISLLDQTGRVVSNKQEYFNSGVNNIGMDVRGIAPGLYYVDVVTEGKHITQKLIIN